MQVLQMRRISWTRLEGDVVLVKRGEATGFTNLGYLFRDTDVRYMSCSSSKLKKSPDDVWNPSFISDVCHPFEILVPHFLCY